MKNVDFNVPFMCGKELQYIEQSHRDKHLSGNGAFTRKCQCWLENTLGCRKALLTHSCTAALEMAAILARIELGDEVIMPSFTFVSTSNAFVLRGGVPVFVDVRPDTFNLDEEKLEAAITDRTRVIVPVHYAGVPCDMDPILRIAERYGLIVIEDAAQGILSAYKGRPLGSLGHLAALSFHETKNVTSGEGGALLINDERFLSRAEIIWEKGTNRAGFARGEVSKYTWVDIGSSFLPSEVVAAFLFAQLEEAAVLIERRLEIWHAYHRAFEGLERAGALARPVVPEVCTHNGHIYYLVLPNLEARTALIADMRARGIAALFHYVPLHDSPAGRRYGRPQGVLEVTRGAGDRLVRLPIWVGMGDEVGRVIDAVLAHFAAGGGGRKVPRPHIPHGPPTPLSSAADVLAVGRGRTPGPQEAGEP
ncbi:MAG: dTDP-4-amino-4,6-dideoxygalactose transaminase [Isosphaeraceae bacterium]